MKKTKQFERRVAKILLFGFVFSTVLLPLFSTKTAFAQGSLNAAENAAKTSMGQGSLNAAENISAQRAAAEQAAEAAALARASGVPLPTVGSLNAAENAYLLMRAAGVQGASTVAQVATDNTPKDPSIGCKLENFEGETFISSCIAQFSYTLFLKPAYIVAGWVSIFLNLVISQLIVGMGNLVNNLPGVMLTWKVLKDIANIFLVFFTIYIGIATILGISRYGDKKLLWKIVLAAILVNFSVTFTKAIIDVSNMLAIATYDQFLISANLDPDCATLTTPIPSQVDNTSPCITNGLAGAFWSQLKLTTLFDLKDLQAKLGNAATPDFYYAIALTAFMGGIMCIAMIFVFGAAAFLLVGRFVILVFLIIVSPVALVLMITGVSNLGSKWWKTLIDQSFFAPLILLMWWIAYKILGSLSDSFLGQTIAGAASPPAMGGNISSFGIILMFTIVITFLFLGLIVAKQLGAAGSQAVLTAGKYGATATAGFMAANTLGRGSAYAQRKYTGFIAQGQQDAAESGKSNVRNWMAGGRIDRALSASAGAGASMKFAGRSSFADRKLSHEKNTSERQGEVTTVGNQEKLREAMNVVNSKYYSNPEKNQQAVIDAARKTISSASQADVEKLRASSPGLRIRNNADTQAMRDSFSKKQASALAAKPDATPLQKKQLTEAAYKGERTAIRTSGTPDPDVNVNKQRSEKIGAMTLTDIKENKDDLKANASAAAHFSNSTWKQIEENKDEVFDANTIQSFRDARKAHFTSLTGDELKNAVRTSKPADLAEHDISFLSTPEFLQNTDTHILGEMQRHGLTKEKRDAMKAIASDEYNKVLRKHNVSSILHTPNALQSANLTPEEHNIVNIHNWFSNDGRGRPSVN